MKLIVKVLSKFLIGLVTAVTSPINAIIIDRLPGLNTALSYVNGFLTWLKDFVLFILSWLPFTQEFWSFFIAVLIFTLTVPTLIDLIKLAVKWWHALAP